MLLCKLSFGLLHEFFCRRRHPGAQVDVGPSLDLVSQDSVRAFASEVSTLWFLDWAILSFRKSLLHFQ